MTSSELETPPLDTARRLAERGDLDGAAAILRELAADPDEPDRAQAAVGLAVVLEERGDVEAARAAARTALATGHPEYASQAACHLAQGFEREGRAEQARAAWQAVLGVGAAGYVPLAHLALARLAVRAHDLEEAERELRAAMAGGDGEIAAHAAQELADLLMEHGEPGAAAELLLDALEAAPGDEAPGLRVRLGIAHLELACAEFAETVEGGADAQTSALAIELLARTLPLRGRDDDAARVWSYGLEHADETLAAEVRLRYQRDT
ncbi:tetratricopeptide repeat protein [Nonomuraea sp. KC401]|uniref:tetratricopeptide repeat protein n=1 Tax=unclassified Nonomuraea TaxID=2593643 RepID=UPI0010FE1961|nr:MULTISPECIES: tetratricopeptide repeat protein [unclassified Nonomuraea]NBE96028.1 tetratricopeptide repeat protein [Nonomuraea sp. K271]TLF64907.1 tetratricopeptide repeat protein [Nonomuraea sp. KC401]